MGVAISTLISRAVVVIRLLLNRHAGPITLAGLFRFHIAPNHIRQILKIGLPNGLENSLFQVGKLIVARLVAGFGASAIAANAIASTVTTFATLPGQAFGLARLTVVGQCAGAKNYPSARRNAKKLMGTSIPCMTVLSRAILLLRTPILTAFKSPYSQAFKQGIQVRDFDNGFSGIDSNLVVFAKTAGVP